MHTEYGTYPLNGSTPRSGNRGAIVDVEDLRTGWKDALYAPRAAVMGDERRIGWLRLGRMAVIHRRAGLPR